jgi:hypothetical protein
MHFNIESRLSSTRCLCFGDDVDDVWSGLINSKKENKKEALVISFKYWF